MKNIRQEIINVLKECERGGIAIMYNDKFMKFIAISKDGIHTENNPVIPMEEFKDVNNTVSIRYI